MQKEAPLKVPLMRQASGSGVKVLALSGLRDVRGFHSYLLSFMVLWFKGYLFFSSHCSYISRCRSDMAFSS